jgi:dTDP-4-amino-4,6-dideoxygalactose transaminase
VKHVIPCANGTDALQIAMMGLDLKPGDEVTRLILRLLRLWK